MLHHGAYSGFLLGSSNMGTFHPLSHMPIVATSCVLANLRMRSATVPVSLGPLTPSFWSLLPPLVPVAGQLLGALLVLVLSRRIPTPLPFVRWDALALSLCWVFALGPPAGGAVHFLSAVAPLLLCVSGGWAAGDVSLLAYIQTHIGNHYTQTVRRLRSHAEHSAGA